MKKKVLAIMLSLVMVFTLAACGNGGNGGDTGESSAPEWKSYDEKSRRSEPKQTWQSAKR